MTISVIEVIIKLLFECVCQSLEDVYYYDEIMIRVELLYMAIRSFRKSLNESESGCLN